MSRHSAAARREELRLHLLCIDCKGDHSGDGERCPKCRVEHCERQKARYWARRGK